MHIHPNTRFFKWRIDIGPEDDLRLYLSNKLTIYQYISAPYRNILYELIFITEVFVDLKHVELDSVLK